MVVVPSPVNLPNMDATASYTGEFKCSLVAVSSPWCASSFSSSLPAPNKVVVFSEDFVFFSSSSSATRFSKHSMSSRCK